MSAIKRGRAGDETSTSDEPADGPSRLPGFPPGHRLHDAWQAHLARIVRETEDAADDPYHPRWEND